MPYDRGFRRIQRIPVIFAHPVDMLFKVSFFQKPGQRVLLEIRYRTGIKSKFGTESAHERRRKNHVADPDGRGEALGESVDVDHLAGGIDTLHGGNRPARQTEFAVVIIFDDVSLFGFRGPRQKFVSPLNRCDDPCWKKIPRLSMGI